MGLLRFLLALAVLIGHSSPILGIRLIHPSVAVQGFYLVSGFYMALILNERYVGPGSTSLFWTNRALRIFPTYWACVAFACLVAWLLPQSPFTAITQFGAQLDATSRALLVAFNALVFGQDWTLFLQMNPGGGLSFTPNFWGTKPHVQEFLLVPQAWSLGLELTFYLIAPFLVRRRLPLLGVVIVASLLIRYRIYRMGYRFDPWTYRFFPSELAMFLLGVVAYRIHASAWIRRLPRPAVLAVGAAGIAAAVLLPFEWTPDSTNRVWWFYSLLLIAVPCLFALTRRSKLDAAIGELSFPMYLLHIAVIWLLQGRGWSLPGLDFGASVALATIALSGAMYFALVRPLDAVRERRVAQRVHDARAEPASAQAPASR